MGTRFRLSGCEIPLLTTDFASKKIGVLSTIAIAKCWVTVMQSGLLP
jgi:hypothetical protein